MNWTLVHETAISTKRAIDSALRALRTGGDPTGFLEIAKQFQDEIMAETQVEYDKRTTILEEIPFLELSTRIPKNCP